jgi:hypothetical protein
MRTRRKIRIIIVNESDSKAAHHAGLRDIVEIVRHSRLSLKNNIYRTALFHAVVQPWQSALLHVCHPSNAAIISSSALMIDLPKK